MESIQTMLQALLDVSASRKELARQLGVSAAALRRWQQGKSRPRPERERVLRERYAQIGWDASLDRINEVRLQLQGKIDKTMLALREVLHRRAQFSSRNEALEELSKLFFAHITAILDGGAGISTAALERLEGNPAVRLREFVRLQVQTRIPAAEQNGIPEDGFTLRLKDHEVPFAEEIVAAFETNCALAGTAYVPYLRGTDILNGIFGKFLADSFVDEKQLGQYLTPQEVVSFLVKLVRADEDPAAVPEGYILDPSCGVGSFLAEYLESVYRDTARDHGAAAARNVADRLAERQIVGVDKSERMVKLAAMNLSMFGYGHGQVRLADSLSVPEGDGELSFLDGSAALIMTNPPFGIEFSGEALAAFGVAKGQAQTPRINSEVLYFDRYLRWLKPGGRLACIIPDSVLNNRGIYEHLRDYLADQVDLKAVISLPAQTFASAGTNTKTSILYLRKKVPGEEPAGPVYMAVCQDVGYDVVTKGTQKRKQATGRSDLEAIWNSYRSRREDKGRWIASAGRERWDAGYHALLSAAFERELSDPANHYVRLREVAELSQEKTSPRRWKEKQFHYIEIADVQSGTLRAGDKVLPCAGAPSRARKVVHANDVIVSTVRPERGVAAVVRAEQDGFVCTTGFAVLRPTAIDAFTLAALLRTEFVLVQLRRCATGVTYPAIEEEALLDVVLPVSASDCGALAGLSEAIQEAERELDRRWREFDRAVERLTSGAAGKKK